MCNNSNNLVDCSMKNICDYDPLRKGKDKMSESKNDHQDIFLFHCCCKSLERVSIWNMNVVDSNFNF